MKDMIRECAPALMYLLTGSIVIKMAVSFLRPGGIIYLIVTNYISSIGA